MRVKFGWINKYLFFLLRIIPSIIPTLEGGAGTYQYWLEAPLVRHLVRHSEESELLNGINQL